MNGNLQIEYVDIDSIDEASYNPRSMRSDHFEKLKGSMRDFGFVDPVIVNSRNRVLVGGHMRRKAWKELGHDELPVVWVDLDEAEEKALNVALNNSELAGTWDPKKLVDVLDAVKAASPQLLAQTGFAEYQVDRFRRQVEAAREKQSVVYPIAARMLEHYDYVVIFTENETDFVHLRQLLGIVTERSYKKQKKGIGRVLPFRKFLERWEGRGAATDQATAADGVGGPVAEGDERPGGADDVRPGAEADGPGEEGVAPRRRRGAGAPGVSEAGGDG